MILNLPFPPPANGLYKNLPRGGRAKTKPYRAWLQEAGWTLQAQRPEHVAGPVHLAFVFGRPDNRKRDLDNLLKGPIDLLVKHEVIDDDRNVQSIMANWGTGEGVEVVVRAA